MDDPSAAVRALPTLRAYHRDEIEGFLLVAEQQERVLRDRLERARARRVVAVSAAETQLIAVRELLADLQAEVEAEEQAADAANAAATVATTRFPAPASTTYPPVLRPERSEPPVAIEAPTALTAGWAPAPPASAPQRTAVLPDPDDEVEFWREATEAEAATNRTVRAVTSFAPVEAVLPAVALLLLLVAVLLLVG